MLSMAVQHNISSIVQPSAYPSPKFALKPLKTPNFVNPKPFFSSSLSSFPPLRKRNRCFSLSRISAEAFYDDSEDIPDAIDEDFYDDSDDIPDAIDDEYATDEEVDEEPMQIPTPVLKDKRGEEPIQKPLLVLKFIWREKNIGLALDQLLPDYGTVPLSPYYFWPRKDAWEELKALLESKPWISQRQMIILLNQVSDIINLWQQSGGNFVS